MQNLVQIGIVVSKKIQFEFLYEHDLGPRSRNDLDLQYSHIFINSIRCLLQLCRKIGQGHSRVIILTNYDGLVSPMLHNTFRGNRSVGSGEEDF